MPPSRTAGKIEEEVEKQAEQDDGSNSNDEVVIRRMSGEVVLRLVRSSVAGWTARDAMGMVRQAISLDNPACAAVGLRLAFGEELMNGDDLIYELWPSDCPILEVVLVLQDKLEEEDVRQSAEFFLDKIGTYDVDEVRALITGIHIETDSALGALATTICVQTAASFMVDRDAVQGKHYLAIVLEITDEVPWFHERNGQPETLLKKFLRACQSAFEAHIQTRPLDVNKMRGILRLCGHLFFQGKLPVKIIGEIMYELIGHGSRLLEDGVECALDLVQIVLSKLQETKHGNALAQEFALRLLQLRPSLRRTEPWLSGQNLGARC